VSVKKQIQSNSLEANVNIEKITLTLKKFLQVKEENAYLVIKTLYWQLYPYYKTFVNKHLTKPVNLFLFRLTYEERQKIIKRRGKSKFYKKVHMGFTRAGGRFEVP